MMTKKKIKVKKHNKNNETHKLTPREQKFLSAIQEYKALTADQLSDMFPWFNGDQFRFSKVINADGQHRTVCMLKDISEVAWNIIDNLKEKGFIKILEVEPSEYETRYPIPYYKNVGLYDTGWMPIVIVDPKHIENDDTILIPKQNLVINKHNIPFEKYSTDFLKCIKLLNGSKYTLLNRYKKDPSLSIITICLLMYVREDNGKGRLKKNYFNISNDPWHFAHLRKPMSLYHRNWYEMDYREYDPEFVPTNMGAVKHVIYDMLRLNEIPIGEFQNRPTFLLSVDMTNIADNNELVYVYEVEVSKEEYNIITNNKNSSIKFDQKSKILKKKNLDDLSKFILETIN